MRYFSILKKESSNVKTWKKLKYTLNIKYASCSKKAVWKSVYCRTLCHSEKQSKTMGLIKILVTVKGYLEEGYIGSAVGICMVG